MKKITTLILSLFLIFSSASSAHAYSLSDALADIKNLKEEVVALRSQIANIPLVANPPMPSACVIDSFISNRYETNSGGTVLLTWTTTGCGPVTIISDDDVVISGNADGSVTVSPTVTTLYTLSASDSTGVDQTFIQKSLTINVLTCTIESFVGTPASILSGESATLSWKIGANCAGGGIDQGIGLVGKTGSTVVSPSTTTTYTISTNGLVNGVSTVIRKTTTVAVQNVGCNITSLTGTPTTVTAGNTARISWTTVGCKTFTISDGSGTLSTLLNGAITVSPKVTTTYRLIATDGSGTKKGMDVDSITITVPQPCKIDSFTASPNPILTTERTTLTWKTSNCTSVLLDGSGGYAPVSSTSVMPGATKVYTLSASGNGAKVSATVTVTVTASCSIDSLAVSPASIIVGNVATLSWKTTGCTSASLNNVSGYPLIASIPAQPTATKVYTLSAVGPDGVSANKSATLTVVTPVCKINAFTVSPLSISAGGSSTLSWSTTDCMNVSINGTPYAATGSVVLKPSSTTTYTLTASRTAPAPNTATQAATVTVVPACTTANITSFTADKTLSTPNAPIVLSWKTSIPCASITINGVSYSNVTGSGTATVNPAVTTTYTLSTGSQTQSLTVSVGNGNCTINSFTSDKTTVSAGSSVILSWKVTDCNSVSIDGVPYTTAAGSVVSTPITTVSKVFTLTARSINGIQKTSTVTVLASNIYGNIDTAFNFGGGANGKIFATALQPDGKVVIGGGFTIYNGVGKYQIARVNANGSLDTTFGTAADFNMRPYALIVQSDGKILVGGQILKPGLTTNAVIRLNANGSLDTTFASTIGNQYVNALALQPDGKIVVGLNFSTNNIVRLNANGSLDTTFTPGTGANGSVEDIALQPDGKMIIVGRFTTYNKVARSQVARINGNGTLDTGFVVGTGATGSGSWVNEAVVQQNGKIVIAGSFSAYNGVNKNGIARLNANGSLDTTSFNTSIAYPGSYFALALQPDGKILAGGFGQNIGEKYTAIVRYNTDSTRDTTFIDSTIVVNNSSPWGSASIDSFALQPDGNIIIGGNFNVYNTSTQHYIARLKNK